MADKIRSFELNTGAKIPSVGLGTYGAKHGVIQNTVVTAVKVTPLFSFFLFRFSIELHFGLQLFLLIQVGYRHIDCASTYNNEKEVMVLTKFQDYFSKTIP